MLCGFRIIITLPSNLHVFDKTSIFWQMSEYWYWTIRSDISPFIQIHFISKRIFSIKRLFLAALFFNKTARLSDVRRDTNWHHKGIFYKFAKSVTDGLTDGITDWLTDWRTNPFRRCFSYQKSFEHFRVWEIIVVQYFYLLNDGEEVKSSRKRAYASIFYSSARLDIEIYVFVWNYFSVKNLI